MKHIPITEINALEWDTCPCCGADELGTIFHKDGSISFSCFNPNSECGELQTLLKVRVL